MDALNKKDINSLEQNRNTLLKYAGEGLVKLDSIQPFDADGSLITACRKVLEYHQYESEKQIPPLSDFLVKSSEFEKIKKAFEAKSQASRTQQDIDTYNKSVNDINAALAKSNKTLNELNAGREKILTNWDNGQKRFMDLHIPKGK